MSSVFIDDSYAHDVIMKDILFSKYKAKIVSVSPIENRNNFERSNRCFLGVSLENSHFHPQKLFAILEWISRRYAYCTVLVGDSIHRLTLQSLKGFQPSMAMAVALELGDEFLRGSQPIFERFSTVTQFEFVKCNAIQAEVAYQYFYNQLAQLYSTDALFKQSVSSFAEHYLRKKLEAIEPLERARRIGLSANYFLEEFAIFACMQQQGHSVMVYPGSFSTLSEIALGVHSQAPKELKALTIVSLCIKGR